MKTRFCQQHPTVLFCFFLFVITVTVFVPHPVVGAISFFGALSYLFVARLLRLKQLAAYGILFLVVATSNPIFVHNGATLLFRIGRVRYTLEALLYGVNTAVFLIAVLLWCHAFSASVGTEKFLYVTGRALPRTALVLATAGRQIPILVRRFRSARCGRLTSGADVPETKADKLRSDSKAFSAVVGEAMEASIETAASMRARDYGRKKATKRKKYRYTATDVVALVGLTTVFLGILGLLAGGMGTYSFYPFLDPINTSVGAWAFYGLFAVMAFYPVLITWKGEWKWRFCVSKR